MEIHAQTDSARRKSVFIPWNPEVQLVTQAIAIFFVDLHIGESLKHSSELPDRKEHCFGSCFPPLVGMGHRQAVVRRFPVAYHLKRRDRARRNAMFASAIDAIAHCPARFVEGLGGSTQPRWCVNKVSAQLPSQFRSMPHELDEPFK